MAQTPNFGIWLRQQQKTLTFHFLMNWDEFRTDATFFGEDH